MLSEGQRGFIEVDLEPEQTPPTQPAPVAPPPPEPTKSDLTLPIVAYGAGGLGLIGGISFALLGQGKESSLEEACIDKACPESASGDLRALRTYKTLSIAGYAVALAGAATGTVLLLTAWRKQRAAD